MKQVSIFLFVLLLTLPVTAEDAKKHTMFFETQSVGVILKDKTVVWSKPVKQGALKLADVNLGDVFFVDSSKVRHRRRNRGRCKLLLSPGKFGWVARDNIRVLDAKVVNGYVDRELYPCYKSLAGVETIGGKTKEDNFRVLKYAILQEGKTFKSCYYLYYDYVKPSPHKKRTPGPNPVKGGKRKPGDRFYKGWVIDQPVCLTYENLYWKVGQHLGIPGGSSKGGSRYEGIETGERFFQLMRKKYPGKWFLVDTPDGILEFMFHSDVTALEFLALLCVKKKDFPGAVRHLEEIIKKYPEIKSGIAYSGGSVYSASKPFSAGFALFKIAAIYADHMSKPEKGIETCLQVIRKFPESKIIGMDYRTTLDIRALGKIVKIGKDHSLSSRYLIKQYQKVIEDSDYSVVKALAAQETTLEKARMLRQKKRFTQAVTLLSKLINSKRPLPMSYIREGNYFWVEVLNLLGTIFIEDLKSPKQALKLCREIEKKYKFHYLAREARLITIFALDRGTGTIQQITELYNNEFKYRHRINEIRSFKSEKGFLKDKKAKTISLREMAGTDATVIKKVKPGTRVNTLYTWKHQGSLWYKVKTADGTIGWVMQSQVNINTP